MKLRRAFLLCALSFCSVSLSEAQNVDDDSSGALNRQKRFKESGCMVTPETDEYEVCAAITAFQQNFVVASCKTSYF